MRLMSRAVVAALALWAAPGVGLAAEMGRVICEGEGPAWHLEVLRSQGRFTAPGSSEQELTGKLAHTGVGAHAWRGRAAGADGQDLVLLLREQACGGAEGVEPLPLTAWLSLPDGRLWTGCCRVPTGPSTVAEQSLTLQAPIRIRGAAEGGVELRSLPEPASGEAIARVESGAIGVVTGITQRDGERWYLVEMKTLPDQPGWIPERYLEPVPAQVTWRLKPEGDWSKDLLDLLPALQACLPRASDPSALVTSAYPMRMGMAGVRLRNPEGRRWHCVASLATGRSVRFDEIPRDLEIAGDGDPLFAREQAVLPAGGGYRHQRVVEPVSGELLGWLAYRTPE